ncbi:MAG: general secretion pathway protein GspK, partial [Alphaproteobacteria bacterium]
MPKRPSLARQRGLALIVVLWAAILLALLAGGVARLSRSDLNLARNLVEATRAELAADSALWTAVHAIVSGGPEPWRTDGTVYAWRFGEAEVRVRVTDELGRIDINAASPELLAALFEAAGTEPEEATGLADAVAEFRDRDVGDPDSLSTGRVLGNPGTAFALTDGLAQVPGMPPDLQNRIAEAITVYTGQARPRRGVTSPLVLAATEGGALAEPVDEPVDEPAAGAGPTAAVVRPTLGGSPVVLGEPSEPARGFSGLIHIEAEALSDGGSHFAR